ncbi:pleckstrin homology domain-containing family A member 6 isoform X7 [Ornithorhynchus anatinus]|uniref:pleckstrin homology domain-containing family A member 6 isoform X7 n=1 Tax=Ornithorhynchus anatinus TaxID=9258 RepID=UPI0019D48E0E|nr:pleckstrin homology domain-containing family A member 6 isoform X7 [Ornithorhynchus anatinus]
MLKFRADRRVSHNEKRTTFLHPVTGQIAEENKRFDLKHSSVDMSSKTGGKRPAKAPNDTPGHNMVSETPPERPSVKASSRSSRKAIAFGKRSNSMKRNPSAAVMKGGWLFKQASSGVKQWNKRWFVLVDRCLFYYKDEKEESILGSIPLLSFRVAAVQPSDNISRKHTFKVTVCWVEEPGVDPIQRLSPQAEHAGVRTYFFSAESPEEQEAWIQAMGEAARVQIPPTQRSTPQAVRPVHEKQDSENIPPRKQQQQQQQKQPARNGVPKAEPEAKTRGEGDGRGCEKLEPKPEQPEPKKEPLAKANGVAEREAGSEPGSPYPEGPRGPASGERLAQSNGWQQYGSPSRPSSMVFPPQDGEGGVQRRGLPARPNLDKIAQRKSCMSQLQQWVNLRRGVAPPEDLRSPSRFYPPPGRRGPDCYGPFSPPFPEDYQYYPPGVRPDSICSLPAFERVSPSWGLEDRPHSILNGGGPHFQMRQWREAPAFARQDGPVWVTSPTRHSGCYDEVDAASGSLRRLSLQPRSRSVPRSPSQGSYSRPPGYSPARSPSARLDRLPPRGEEIYTDPSAYMLRRSVSSPKYDYLGDRRPVPAGMYPYNYPPSPTVHDKMDELLDLQLQRNLEYLDQQVSPYPGMFRDGLHSYKMSEQDTDNLLGKLCEQNKVVREQDRLVQQLRAEKESLESALMGTHQELEMFGSQPAYPEKLLHKKESLQNQLINIRGELSQATTALTNSTLEYENLEGEVSALHDDLWEQLNLDIQNEVLNRQIQKEIWRIQDVMEGLRKTNPSRGTDTAKHRGLGPSGTYSSNSPASPLSSASLTSPLSPFSLVSGSQGSPTKPGPHEEPSPPRPPLPKSYVPLESPPTFPPLPGESRLWPYPGSPSWHHSSEVIRGQAKLSSESGKDSQQMPPLGAPRDVSLTPTWQDPEAVNKVGIVPPRTKSPTDEGTALPSAVVRRGAGGLVNGLFSRERPKSAVFPSEVKVKMSLEEQIARMRRHQSGSMKDKRRSLQLPAGPPPDPAARPAYKVRGCAGPQVRRHRSIHEVDISNLEAALRSEEPGGRTYETPREEIARLRKMELEPQHYDVDINKELSTPDKVLIPERYIELEPDTPLSPEEEKEKQKKVERIKTLIAKSSMQNVVPASEGESVDVPQDSESQLQEQEKRIEISCTLATEASRRGRMLSAQCATPSPPTSPASPTPPANPLSSEPSRGADGSHFMRV